MHPTDRFIPLRPTENNYFSLNTQGKQRNTNLTRHQELAQQAYQNAVMAACGLSTSNVLSFSSRGARAAHPALEYVAQENQIAKETALLNSYHREQPRCVKILDAPEFAPYNYATHIALDGNRLAAALEGGISVVNVMNRAAASTLETSLDGIPTCVHWIGQQLFAATEKGAYCIIDAESLRQATSFKYNSAPIFSATSTPTSVFFTSETEVFHSDIRSLHQITSTALHSATITQAVLHSDATQLATADEAGTVAVWDLRNLEQIYGSSQGSAVTDLKWHPANSDIFFSSQGNSLRALSMLTQESPICQMEVDGAISAINTSQTGPELVISQDGSPSLLKVIRFANGQFEYLVNSPVEKGKILDMASGSNFTVTIDDSETIRVWDRVFTPAAPARKPFKHAMLR